MDENALNPLYGNLSLGTARGINCVIEVSTVRTENDDDKYIAFMCTVPISRISPLMIIILLDTKYYELIKCKHTGSTE